MSESAGKQGEVDRFKGLLEGIVQSSKRIMLAYALSIIAIALIAFLALIGMAAAGVAAVVSTGDLSLPSPQGPSPTLLIPVIIIIALLLIIPSYIMFSGARVLKSAVEGAGDHPIARELDLPVKIMYLSALGILVGLATLIILVGIIILMVASLGWAIGVLLYGLALRKIDPALSTGGTLIVVGVVLQLLALIPINVLGLLGLIGFLLELIGFYVVYSDAGKLLGRLGQEGSPGYTAPASEA